jgi:hypothetical protein
MREKIATQRELRSFIRSGFEGSGAVAAMALACAACGGEDATAVSGEQRGEPPVSSGAFALEGDFVSIEKATVTVPAQERTPSAADLVSLAELPDSSSDFYLAIKRSALSERWFLSAFMKQFYPYNANGLGDSSFGTRVVRFEPQGDRLFMFDASDRFKASEVGNPELVVEAYPIVRSAQLDGLPGASDYVFIDPSRGLNEFSVSGNVYSDPYLPPSLGAVPLRLGLSFTRNFRRLPDGAAFEEVFAGDLDLGTDTFDVWGTLGVTLRRYAEGEGFVPTADPGVLHYFMSDPRLVPDSGGQVARNPIRWNFHPGMQPVPFYVSAGAQRAQADNPDADLIGALRRGIESWNDVLGFQAIEAVFVDDDRVRDDDESIFMVDYPGEGLGFAFANFRTNPNSGEVRGGSVYMSGVFFDFSFFESEPETESEGPAVAGPKPLEPAFVWNGMPTSGRVCELDARALYARSLDGAPEGLSADEQGERYIQFVAAHEMGHVLGLRHNFKGSLLPPSGSVMEYPETADAVAIAGPREYDRSAIRYLYQQTTDLPSEPFCTDVDISIDPTCIVFDAGSDPLHDWAAPGHELVLDLIFDGLFPVDILDVAYLNPLLGFARDEVASPFVPPPDRAEAIALAFGRSAAPLAPEDAADPAKVDIANAIAEFVLRRIVLDPVELRGDIPFDLSDPGAIAALVDQTGKLLRNEDGVRSFQLRRVAVDVLRGLQTDAALLELRQAREALWQQRRDGQVPAEQVPLVDDLLARMDAALTPYYE